MMRLLLAGACVALQAHAADKTIGRNDALDTELTLAQGMNALDATLSKYINAKVNEKPLDKTPLEKPKSKAKSQQNVEALMGALASPENHDEVKTPKQHKAVEDTFEDVVDNGEDPLSAVDKVVAKSEARSQKLKPATPLPEPPEEAPARQRLRASAKASARVAAAATKKPISVPVDAESKQKVIDELTSSSTSEQSAMEKSITEMMMAGGSLGATPFGKSVGQIKDLISKDMMPKVMKAHTENQEQLFKLSEELHMCETTKNEQIVKTNPKKKMYESTSALHKTCREGESADHMAKIDCLNELKDKKDVMELKCKEFSMTGKRYGDQKANSEIVKKGGSEQTESYVRRMTATICGRYVPTQMGLGGGGLDGFLDLYMKAKIRCEKATSEYRKHKKKCKNLSHEYAQKKSTCDSLQDQMDGSSCKRAIGMKDACETYAECYFDRRKSFDTTEKMVRTEERDRKAEWRGLKRMECLMEAFSDGKVKSSEITVCKNQVHSLVHLDIKYPKVPPLVTCNVPDLYPSTPAYKLREFAGLPSLAKGREDANECTGVVPIPTVPRKGSPRTCTCQRATLNGPYSAGPLVVCNKCRMIRRSLDVNSCPDGTKLFSPSTPEDWKTIFSSVGELPAPYWIVDVTRPQNGNGGSNDTEMHSGAGNPDNPVTWRTADDSPWWLRSTPSDFGQPSGNYHSNCYLAITKPYGDANDIRFEADGCEPHANSYYCQLRHQDIKPKRGSPAACKCENVVLTGAYSAGALIKCTGCLPVARSTQKNSCPVGTKIFSPAGSKDWKTFLASAQPLRSPHWIVDVTRPQNGCGGCGKYAMNSKNPAQMTWRTSDGSPWWLRSSKYNEPTKDYFANCYMDLFQPPPNENALMFRTKKCRYFSNSYYCQPVKPKKSSNEDGSDDTDEASDADASSGSDGSDDGGEDAPKYVPGDALLQRKQPAK